MAGGEWARPRPRRDAAGGRCRLVRAALALAVVFAAATSATGGDLAGPKVERGQDPASPPTSEVLLYLAPGTDASAFARDRGLTIVGRMKSDPNGYLFDAGSADAARRAVGADDPRVAQAYLNERSQNARNFAPNDPYFPANSPAGFPGQWHLKNTAPLGATNAGLDVKIQGAWDRGLTGGGVIIGVVDDGLQTAHPDLAPNYSASNSFDFGQNDSDPNPVYGDDVHGIATSGVAAARGGNGAGVAGAAPHAGLAGLREDFHFGTAAQFADAIAYHSSGADTSIGVKNHSYGASSPYVLAAAETNALATSTAAGTIHVWSAGNDRDFSGEDANKKDLQNSPGAITVAAMGSSGQFADYSNFGANVFVTAPSNSFRPGELGITTTDRTGDGGYNAAGSGDGDPFPDADYTSVFGGTSSAAPLVAGIMALGKEAQPDLDTRFAKHLLAMTSRVVDAGDSTFESDGGWRTNAAGYHFNQNYGFGLIDADQFTLKATQYSGVTPLETVSIPTTNVGLSIADNNLAGVTQTFTVSGLTQPLEEVLVTLNVTHTYRGDLEAILTSPSGTTSRLMIRSISDGSDDLDWQFLTNMFWGEAGNGVWSLNVRDVFAGDTGRWNSFSVILRAGSLIPVPEPSGLALLGLGGLGMIFLARRRRRAG